VAPCASESLPARVARDTLSKVWTSRLFGISAHVELQLVGRRGDCPPWSSMRALSAGTDEAFEGGNHAHLAPARRGRPSSRSTDATSAASPDLPPHPPIHHTFPPPVALRRCGNADDAAVSEEPTGRGVPTSCAMLTALPPPAIAAEVRLRVQRVNRRQRAISSLQTSNRYCFPGKLGASYG
jgi:hypothetical protein